ncbi:MGF_110-14L [African swine fever virus]|nr:MGF_110-14L [African swine fever virus]
MKVLGLLLGYSVLILAHELPELPRTQHPPKEELPYWCTYVKNCDFCWDCQNGICTLLKNYYSKNMLAYDICCIDNYL